MPVERAASEGHDTTDEQQRRRWMVASIIVAVFLVALLIGMWVGGDVFAS